MALVVSPAEGGINSANLKVVVLLPSDHFHAPIVLRGLVQFRPDNELVVLTTPKITGRGTFPERISRLIKESGIDYFCSMVASWLRFRALRIWEQRIRIPLKRDSKRYYLTVPDVIREFHLPHYRVININHPKYLSLLSTLKPDIIITIFFNQVLKERVIQLARVGCFNLHPSCLPAYRGISPCFWVLANNEVETGVTLHRVIARLDKGEIINQAKVPILPEDSLFGLYRRCAETGLEVFKNSWEFIEGGGKGTVQDEHRASYCGVITPRAVRRFRSHHRRFF